MTRKMVSGSTTSLRWMLTCIATMLSWHIFSVGVACAQNSGGGQFGGQARADAASQAIVLAVQQGISSLPPTSGQSFSWTYNPTLEVFERDRSLGPISFRSPQTIGEGRFAFRFAASYFDLSETLGPIDYLVNIQGQQDRYGRFGTRVDTSVGLLNFGLNYGFTEWLEASINIPVTIVDAQASNLFSSPNPPPGGNEFAAGLRFTRAELRDSLKNGELVIRDKTFTESLFDFNDGTHAGVGRISVGAKALILSKGPVRVAASTEFFCPSPNEDQFSGSESPAILPRVIGMADLAPYARLHVDAGYDYDFDVDELRRFVWNIGGSFPLTDWAMFDLGMGGSVFNSGIRWTPKRALGVSGLQGPTTVDTTITAQEDTTLGTNFVDFLGGIRFLVSRNVVLTGAVNVPVNSDGLRPAAVGTGAVEVYF